MKKNDKALDDSRLIFAPLTMERYSLGPLSITISIIVWSDTTVIMITGIPEHKNEKIEQNR